MRKYFTGAVVFCMTIAAIALAQTPERLPPPRQVSQMGNSGGQSSTAATPATPNQPPRTPGFEQLRKFLFPLPTKGIGEDKELKGARALYKKTLTLWKENALVFMNLNDGSVNSKKTDEWYGKWEKLSKEIRNDKDYEMADLLILQALSDLKERFNYYLTPDEVEDENKRQDPTTVGIGATIDLENENELTHALPKTATEEDFERALKVDAKHRIILTPIKGSPAEKEGMLKGDILQKVDGIDVNGKLLRDVYKLIKGKAGSQIVLDIERVKGDKTESVKLYIRRQPFTHPTVHLSDLENNIVLLKYDHFSADNGQAEMEAALRDVQKRKLEEKKPVKLILDLRNNPGGRLDFAINIVSMMLPEGNIVTLKERKGNDLQISRYTATRDALIYSYPAPQDPKNLIAISTEKRVLILPEDVPLVIIVNHRSASASELTSGALQYYGRAVVVGEPTYGKGVGQQVYELPEKRRGKVIKFIFYPGDQDIDWKGILPNDGYELKWKMPEKPGQDNQLELAKKAVLAEYDRIEAARKRNQEKGNAAIERNKSEFEKRQQAKERGLKMRIEELKKQSAPSDGTAQPGAQPGTQPGAPGVPAKPDSKEDKKTQPGQVPTQPGKSDPNKRTENGALGLFLPVSERRLFARRDEDLWQMQSVCPSLAA